jgi:hypothetical protein
LGNTKGISTIQAKKRLNTYPSGENFWEIVSCYGRSLFSFSELNVDMAENGTVSGIGKRE